VQGLDTPVSRRCFFSVLRLEEEFLENRLFALLDANKNGFISLEEVLLALSRTAAGEPLRQSMRLHEAGQQRVGGPHEWEDSPNAVRRQAAFAFQLYDLDGNGELTAKEVAVLVAECIGGNARVVENNIHAIGAVHNAMVDEHGFRLMALHASNFLFPAFRLQQRMAQYGQTASEALAALRQFFGEQEGRTSSSSAAPKRSPIKRPANQAFDFGDEKETPPPAPRASRQSHQSHHDRPDAVVPPPMPQVMHNGGGRYSQDRGMPAPPGRQPRQSYGPSSAHVDEFVQHSEAGRHAQGARQYPSEEDVAAAFRDVRLGRTADIESAVTLGALPIDVIFQPHGATLLHVAAAHGHRSMCKRLLALGAPAAALDALGRSAAEVALAYRHWEVASMLRVAGVPVSPEAEMHSLRERSQWASEAPHMQRTPQAMWQPGTDRTGWDGGAGLQEEEEDWHGNGRQPRHSRGGKLA
jgi:Ca2+-binding EF-hand superfamily protein